MMLGLAQEAALLPHLDEPGDVPDSGPGSSEGQGSNPTLAPGFGNSLNLRNRSGLALVLLNLVCL